MTGIEEASMLDIRATILSQIEQVASEQNKALAPLHDDLVLLDSGLDSLCFAVIVVRLEDVLGVYPFATADNEGFPITVGDLVRSYEAAAATG